MRKAHQNEVQKEISRFRDEFIRQFNSKNTDLASMSSSKERELEEVRQEILAMSEKYSMKCVETISLEEKLRMSQQKLKQYQSMQQMEMK